MDLPGCSERAVAAVPRLHAAAALLRRRRQPAGGHGAAAAAAADLPLPCRRAAAAQRVPGCAAVPAGARRPAPIRRLRGSTVAAAAQDPACLQRRSPVPGRCSSGRGGCRRRSVHLVGGGSLGGRWADRGAAQDADERGDAEAEAGGGGAGGAALSFSALYTTLARRLDGERSVLVLYLLLHGCRPFQVRPLAPSPRRLCRRQATARAEEAARFAIPPCD